MTIDKQQPTINNRLIMEYEMMGAIEELNSYYIESRYTEDIEELTRQFTEAKTTSILESTEEIFKWIKAKL